ncbi:VanZ family protein [Rhodocyclaceae bacterium SMB388]
MTSNVSDGFRPDNGIHSPLISGWTALAFALVLAYLNLIPLRVTWLPLEQWWQAALSMPWLSLSVARRADWIANLFMFVPFGFLLGTALGGRSARLAVRLVALAVGVVVVVLLAVAIESLQILVPQRTVSLNDVLAASLGGVIGLAVWLLMGRRLWEMARLAAAPGRQALLAGLALYCVFYLALSPFPYDFVLSADELSHRLDSGRHALLLAGSCASWARCGGQVVQEVVVAVPFGMLLAVWLRWPVSLRTFLLAGGLGAALGVVIELVQLLTFSGVSQGVSVITRAVGVAAGALVVGVLQSRGLRTLQLAVRPLATVVLLPYLVAVFVLTGFLSVAWGDWASAMVQLGRLNFLPFYYHYFVTEQAAMASLLQTTLLYLPVGVLLWPWEKPGRRLAWLAAALAVMLAFVVETLKLFALDLRPDPSNLLVAAFAGWLGVSVLEWLSRALDNSLVDRPIAELEGASARAAPVEGRRTTLPRDDGSWRSSSQGAGGVGYASLWVGWRLAGGVLLILALGFALRWPSGAIALTLGVALYAALLWRFPAAWLLVVPVMVPVLDLSLFTGFMLFDELDLFLLTTLGMLLLRGQWWPRSVGLGWAIGLSLAGYLLVVFLGLAMLLPALLQEWGQGFHYAGAWNGVRAVKGLLWAVLLVALLRLCGPRVEVLLRRWLLPGLLLALAATVVLVLWERATYPGLLNLGSRYRISGLFTDMHVGGPSIETWLTMSLPFSMLGFWYARKRWFAPLLLVFLGGLYALVVTYSRAGYVGLGLALALIVLGAVVGLARHAGKRRWRLVFAVVAPLVLAAAALPVMTGSFFEQRMSQVSGDFDLRTQHWEQALAIRGPGVAARLLGEGPGAFPGAYRLHLSEGRVPGNYAVLADRGLLVIGSGDSVYVDQRLGMLAKGEHRFEARVRADRASRLRVHVCEKFVYYSFKCRTAGLPVGVDQFGDVSWTFETGDLGTGPWFARRGLVLSLSNATSGSLIEIDSVSLTGPDGGALLRNGDFSAGATHWFFTTDHFLPWRVENQFIEILFDHGWLGLAAFALLVGVAMARLTAGAIRGRFDDAVMLASLAGVLGVGFFSSVFWSPRLMFMFYLILLLGLLASAEARKDQGLRATTSTE